MRTLSHIHRELVDPQPLLHQTHLQQLFRLPIWVSQQLSALVLPLLSVRCNIFLFAENWQTVLLVISATNAQPVLKVLLDIGLDYAQLLLSLPHHQADFLPVWHHVPQETQYVDIFICLSVGRKMMVLPKHTRMIVRPANFPKCMGMWVTPARQQGHQFSRRLLFLKIVTEFQEHAHSISTQFAVRPLLGNGFNMTINALPAKTEYWPDTLKASALQHLPLSPRSYQFNVRWKIASHETLSAAILTTLYVLN